MPRKRISKYLFLYALLYGIAAFLLFYNLSDRLMWGDEAETALLGRNILKFGIPIVDDGKNLLTQYPEPWESNEHNVWTWNTWLPYYLTAISFRVLGTTTFAARMPFVIIVLLAVVLMRPATLALYENESKAFIATLLLVASVPFLLHARQCRYYSITELGTPWVLIGYTQLAFRGRTRAGLSMAVALIVLFYASFISFVGNSLAVGAHSLFLGRRDFKFLRRFIPYYSLTIIAVLPWIFYSGMLLKGSWMKPEQAPVVFFQYVYRINFHIFPLVLLLFPVVSLLARRVHGGTGCLPGKLCSFCFSYSANFSA